MKRKELDKVIDYMESCMRDMVHDKNHVYRVLYFSLLIWERESLREPINLDAVIIGAILHDIGRDKEYKDKTLCHAKEGSIMAYDFLIDNNYSKDFASHVREIVLSHRFSDKREIKTIEAKIVFDSDKLDLTGTVGVSRALIYGSGIREPLYNLNEEGLPLDSKKDKESSIYREYNRKLKYLYKTFHTDTGRKIAMDRQKSMDSYFESMFSENATLYERGSSLLRKIVKD